MKKKLKLNQLNVESFITSNEQSHVKGGESIATVCVNDSIYPTHCCITIVYPTMPVQNCLCPPTGAYNCPTHNCNTLTECIAINATNACP
jgi:hypothetical protein